MYLHIFYYSIPTHISVRACQQTRVLVPNSCTHPTSALGGGGGRTAHHRRMRVDASCRVVSHARMFRVRVSDGCGVAPARVFRAGILVGLCPLALKVQNCWMGWMVGGVCGG